MKNCLKVFCEIAFARYKECKVDIFMKDFKSALFNLLPDSSSLSRDFITMTYIVTKCRRLQVVERKFKLNNVGTYV